MAKKDDIMDAVDASENKSTEPQKTKAEKAESKPAKDAKSDGDSFMTKVKNFIYKYPFIAMIGFYLILSIFVKFWGWATIIFLAIPLVAAIRVYMLSSNLDRPIEGENHRKLFWWARVGLYSSVAGLISIIILDWLNILHVFN